MIRFLSSALISMTWIALSAPSHALTIEQSRALTQGDVDSRVTAIQQVLTAPDDKTAALLQAMADDAVKVDGAQVFLMRDGKAFDPVTGQELAVPSSAEDVINNNRMRGEIDAALSALQLLSPDVAKRSDAVKLMLKEPDITKLPMLEKALAVETDSTTKKMMFLARAAIKINSEKSDERLNAAKVLAQNQTPDTVLLLNQRLSQEDNKEVRNQIESSLKIIQSALGWGRN